MTDTVTETELKGLVERLLAAGLTEQEIGQSLYGALGAFFAKPRGDIPADVNQMRAYRAVRSVLDNHRLRSAERYRTASGPTVGANDIREGSDQ